jgi:hypothetical protein
MHSLFAAAAATTTTGKSIENAFFSHSFRLNLAAAAACCSHRKLNFIHGDSGGEISISMCVCVCQSQYS